MTSGLGYCELSNIFIGKSVNITTNGIDYGFSYKNNDVKNQSSTRYGQEYIDLKTQRKELNGLSMKVMNPDEIDSFYEVYDDRTTVKPLFIIFCDDTGVILNDIDRISGQYKFTTTPSSKLTTVGLWDTTFRLREQK